MVVVQQNKKALHINSYNTNIKTFKRRYFYDIYNF